MLPRNLGKLSGNDYKIDQTAFSRTFVKTRVASNSCVIIVFFVERNQLSNQTGTESEANIFPFLHDDIETMNSKKYRMVF